MYYHIAEKFGGELNLVVWQSNFAIVKLTPANISHFYNMCMVIPYQTVKFKSTNMQWQLGVQPSNLILANIFGYLVYCYAPALVNHCCDHLWPPFTFVIRPLQ